MKIQGKPTQSIKKVSSMLLVNVIRRKNNRYFYTKQISKNLFKSKVKVKKILKKQPSLNISSIKIHQQSQLLQVQNFNFKEPFLVTDVELPHITIPEQLQVAIHSGQQISYEENTLYYRLKTSQLMESMQPKNCKNATLNFSVPQMQLKPQQYQTPALISKFFRKLHKVNLWIYFGRRSTDWHYDGHDNFLYVLDGKKQVYLTYHINIKSKNVFSLFNNHCQLVNQQKIPIIKAVIQKGKCLFIPKGWWHKVVTYGNPSIAVNFWGNSISQILQSMSQIEKTLILKTLLFDVATDCCKNFVPGWLNLSQKQMEEKRKSIGKQILQLL